MSAITFVAAMGRPLNNTGLLVPVFKKNDGMCFQAGDTRGKGFAFSTLSELSSENAAILLENRRLHGDAFTINNLRTRKKEADRYGLPANIFYLSKNIMESLGGDSKVIALSSQHNGLHVRPVEASKNTYSNFTFFLFSQDDLVNGFIPVIFNNIKDQFDKILSESFGSRGGKKDNLWFTTTQKYELDNMSQAMINIAYDQNSLVRAIKYQGLMILKSPKAENFRVWLNLILKRWDIRIKDVNYWKNLAYGVFDKAENNNEYDKRLNKKSIGEIYLRLDKLENAINLKGKSATVDDKTEILEKYLKEPIIINVQALSTHTSDLLKKINIPDRSQGLGQYM